MSNIGTTHTEQKTDDDRSLGEKAMDALSNVANSIKEVLSPELKNVDGDVANPALMHQDSRNEKNETEKTDLLSSTVTTGESHCCTHGPGYASPKEAMLGPREKVLFVTCPRYNSGKPDMIATVDVDPMSETYCKIISRVDLPYPFDEVHHTGWNACSSCFGDTNVKRSHLVVPCLNSSRIYFIDARDPKNLTLVKTLEPDQLIKNDISFPHTSHCLADGNIMINTLGDANGKGKGDFVLIDSNSFEVTGTWVKDKAASLNYDFWYQPRHNVMISTEWGPPDVFKKGFDMKDALSGKYGTKLNIWNWKERTLRQTIELDPKDGCMPFEIRFVHNPDATDCFFVSALGSALYHVYKQPGSDKFVCDKVVQVAPKSVKNWTVPPVQVAPKAEERNCSLPEMPGLTTDLLISLDDRFLYFSCYLHGDVRQYDISDPFNPKLVGQVFLGGSIHTGTKVEVTKDLELQEPPPPCLVKSRRIEGGPQMLQLSLDGKRLYVTTSLYSVWDQQFYPELIRAGSVMVQLDVDTIKGGLTINPDFLIDFGAVPDGPFLAHEMRYPGGDCTSDIWV